MIPYTVLPRRFNLEQLAQMVQAIESCSTWVDYHDQEGPWKDRGTVANIHHWDWQNEAPQVRELLTPELAPLLGDFAVDRSHILDARLPWDIHNDTVIRCEVKDTVPQAVVMIPLQDCDAKTVVFDQHADYDNFGRYRENNKPIPNHVPVDLWNHLLSHCWPKDRFWLSIQAIYEWRSGDIVIFDRRQWHASDNFLDRGLEGKRAIILFTGTREHSIISNDQEIARNF